MMIDILMILFFWYVNVNGFLCNVLIKIDVWYKVIG